MLNMNRPERWVLFCSLLFGGWVRVEVDAPGHVCGEQSVTWPQSQLERGLLEDAQPTTCWMVGGCRPGLYPSASCKCSSEPHMEQRWSLVPKGCVPVSLHPWAAGHSWQSAGRAGAGLRSWVWAVGSGYWSLSALRFLPPFPAGSTRKDQCFMANTQPDLFRIDLSFFGQLHTFLFFQNMYCIIDSNKFLYFIAKLSFFFWSCSKTFFV